ncbi:hypothetical protein [Flavobacterium sp. XS2P12]|uniref:hypothetical protein n=1 Tax=Flavobacterium melibiosi TaxID=3398734 RepID=UPI003A87CA2C
MHINIKNYPCPTWRTFLKSDRANTRCQWLFIPSSRNTRRAAELVFWYRNKPLGVRGSGFARASISFSGNEYERRQQASKM